VAPWFCDVVLGCRAIVTGDVIDKKDIARLHCEAVVRVRRDAIDHDLDGQWDSRLRIAKFPDLYGQLRDISAAAGGT
jgi:hypothetical protein